MRCVILGAGDEERAWAEAVRRHPAHELTAASPGFAEWPEIAVATDLETLLATPGAELVILGGPKAMRSEALRRAAAEGFTIVVIHPPGDGPEDYDQVALAPSETGAVILPDLLDRLRPEWARLRRIVAEQAIGSPRRLRCEGRSGNPDVSLADWVARLVDPARWLLGEVVSVTAHSEVGVADGEPERLVVIARTDADITIELDLRRAPSDSVRWRLEGTAGEAILDEGNAGGSRTLTVRPVSGVEERVELGDSPERERALNVLAERRGEATDLGLATLADGTRASEIAAAAVKSAAKGRVVKLERPEATELGNFKSVMAATGCLLILLTLVVFPIALTGPALGFPQTLYLAWVIPPVLLVFAVFQILRFAIRGPGEVETRSLE